MKVSRKILSVTDSNDRGKTLRVVDNNASSCYSVAVESKPLTINRSKKGAKKMSTTETISTAVSAIKETIKKTIKFFNLASFTREKKEIQVEFVPATTYSEAVDRLGNDEKALVAAINDILRSRAISEAKKKELGSNGIGLKVALEFIKPFRMSPEYAKLVTLEKGQDGWKAQYNAQTDALLKQVASNEFMLSAIRASAAASVDTDDDETDE